jgi:hypothetical protein
LRPATDPDSISRVADASGSFAEVMRTAVEVRGLGLERIRERLEARGITVSVATLSYWQSGRSQPGRKQSLAALPHLEEVLELDRGVLRGALTPPRERGRRCPVVDLDAVWPEPPQTRVLRRLDTRWDAELERISMHDVVTMGPDRSQEALTVRQVLRARCDGPDRRVIMHCLEDARAGVPEIRALRGCRLGTIARDIPSGIIGCELVFLEPLRRGQTVVVDYEVLSAPPRPRELRHTRRLRLPMRQYLLEVRFDAGALPSAAFHVRDGKDCQPLELDAEHSLHVVDTDCTAGITGVRWAWPDDEPT